MRFKVIVGDQVYAVELPEGLLEGSREFHDKLDADMDRLQRCQIAADRLLTGLMQQNEATVMLMASYIALRMPGVVGVNIDTEGEMQNTELLYA
jgi:hypothetical protein